MKKLILVAFLFLPILMMSQVDVSDGNWHFESGVVYDDTFWDDLRFPATRVRQGATSKPDFDVTDIALLFPVDDSTEKVYLNVQMPHKWKAGTSIEPHVHWQQASSDTVQFRIKYRLNPLGGAFGTWKYLESEAMVFTYTSGTLHQMVDFPLIDMTGMGESSMLDIILYRIDAGGSGSLNSDMLFKEFDIHFEIDKPGSDNEIP